VFGPDGNLYVSGFGSDNVLRYSGTTGALLGVFASGGGLDSPLGLVFGPDGNLYVSSAVTDNVLRYDGTTGAFPRRLRLRWRPGSAGGPGVWPGR
jgi:hypothetical protein